MKAAFERILSKRLTIPEHFDVMGGLGAALLAREAVAEIGASRFRGFEASDLPYRLNSFDCEGCSNCCEVMEVKPCGPRMLCGNGLGRDFQLAGQEQPGHREDSCSHT